MLYDTVLLRTFVAIYDTRSFRQRISSYEVREAGVASA